MDRKEFLSMIGYGAASLTVLGCLGACTKNSDATGTNGPANIDFMLDLTQASNSALKNNGGYVYANGVIVARTLTGQYIAVQQSCTHEANSLSYDAGDARFYCDRHGATFTESGSVTNGPASRPLTAYHTSLSGNSLRVYS